MAKSVKKNTKVSKEVKEVKVLNTVKNFLPKFSTNLTVEQMRERISMLKIGMSQSISLSTSTSILALLLFIGAPSVFPEIINPYLPSSLKIMQGIVVVPSVLWIFTILDNVIRSVMIFKLQKKISSK